MKNKDRKFIIVSVGILVVALAILIIGYYLAGTNLLEFLKTKYAMYVYMGIGVWVVVAVIYLIKEKVKKL